jgi:sucrose-6-phosphate hydrolase SacC (GH32 family)
MVREFQVELAESEPDYWMFLDVREWQGKEGVIQIAKMAKESKGLKSIFVDTTVIGFDSLYREKYRPQFHFTSRRGWHNDPNGLVFYKGEYHLFYQHDPLCWNPCQVTWGHAISTDLVHWKEMAPAIYPDQMGLEFSGSGVVDWNNTAGFQQGDEKTLVLIYTAAGGLSVWSKDQPLTQCIAYSTDKGRTWTKYSGNPVLQHIIGGDPKVVWFKPDRKWIMALFLNGNRFGLFTSGDLKSWTQIQEITIEGGHECPDFFEIALDNDPKKMKWVLTAANGRFLMGSFDGKQFKPETESYPSDFSAFYSPGLKNYYAVQSFSDIQDGRRIQVGWMLGSEFKGMPFNQQFAFPRELTLKTTMEGIRLYGVPVREIEILHSKKQSWSNMTVKPEDNPLSSLKGELYHIISEFVIDKNTAKVFGFNLRGFEVLYNTRTGMISAHRPTDNVMSEVKLLPERGKIRIEILLDRASVEIYANNGKVPMSFFYIPKDGNKQLSLVCKEGNVLLNSMHVYELISVWNVPTT